MLLLSNFVVFVTRSRITSLSWFDRGVSLRRGRVGPWGDAAWQPGRLGGAEEESWNRLRDISDFWPLGKWEVGTNEVETGCRPL
jgi:hypothetical protein